MLNLDDYRETITYSEDPTQALGTDELLLLLAELIDDDQITKVVGQYVDDFDKGWIELEDTMKRLDTENKAYVNLIDSIRRIIRFDESTALDRIKELIGI